MLLDRGLDENHRDNAGWGPLHYATFEGHSVIVKLLGNAGAELDMIDCDGKTGLHLACSEGHYDVVVQLLRAGANVNLVNLQVIMMSVNKPKGLKVAKEYHKSIGSMVNGLNGP